MHRICFDHLSGAPVEPAVLEAMLSWFGAKCGGTGTVHSGGIEARTALDAAREQVARLINASSPEEIIFTSSGTESLNLAVKGCAWANQRRGKNIVVSTIEHPAVMQSAEFLEATGFSVTRVGVSKLGLIDPAALRESITDETTLVCVHAAHHDIGTIQNLRALGDVVSETGVALLVDATYAGGWMPLDVQAINASYLALAPHRFGGPKGVGILYKQRRARLTPLLHGGAQELGWRAGSENIPGIVGTGIACEIAAHEMTSRIAHVTDLQTRLWAGLQKIAKVRLNGATPGPSRLPNTLNVSFAGIEGEGLALALDLKGVAVTSGQACTTKANKIPATLAAIGADEEFAPGTIIISLGKENTADEVDQFLDILSAVIDHLRSLS